MMLRGPHTCRVIKTLQGGIGKGSGSVCYFSSSAAGEILSRGDEMGDRNVDIFDRALKSKQVVAVLNFVYHISRFLLFAELCFREMCEGCPDVFSISRVDAQR